MPFFRLSDRVLRSPDTTISVPTLPAPATSRDDDLPPAGTLTLGRVELPVGRPAVADRSLLEGDDARSPALWLTDGPVPDAAVVWRLLVDRFPSTGLWPLVLRPLYADDRRPWDSGEFQPAAVSAVDALEPARLLSAGWADGIVPIGGPSVHPAIERALEPFGADFPGLGAPLPRDQLSESVPAVALTPRRGARIGLVRCRRPADAVVLIGWLGSINVTGPAEVSAVLRSWEDRFGVVLAGLSFDVITLLVPHPPQDAVQALPIAAEIAGLCPDALWQGSDETLHDMSSTLVDRPVWHLWFD